MPGLEGSCVETKLETLYVRHGRLHYFVREVLKRLRVPGPNASKVGDALVAADLAGIEGEGVRRLPFLASRISSRLVKPDADVQIVHQDQAIAVVDGANALGHIVAMRSMEIAISQAKRFGVSAVVARNSNDFGMAGYYARLALEDQMVGIVMSNAAPVMLPTYGTRPMLGSNPLAIAIPTAEGEAPFVLDMSTTATSRPHLEDLVRRREPLASGNALDASGKPTTDPGAALEAMHLLPLGSLPATGSHKGFGLALAIDILCGVLSGGNFGRHLAGAEGSRQSVAEIGHCFIVIRVKAFGPWVRFRNSIKEMMRQITGTPAAGAPRVYYPGETEFAIDQERRANGIPIPPDVASELEKLSRQLDIHEAWEHVMEGRKA